MLEVVHDARQAGQLSQQLQPHVLAADVGQNSAALADILALLRKRSAATRLVVFNAPIDHQSLRCALVSGAQGYLGWDATLGEFRQALEAVAAGESCFSDSIRRLMEEQYVAGAQAGAHKQLKVLHLSEREKEIARGVAQGRRTKDIADNLALSIRTVEKHRENIRKKQG